MEHPVFTTGKRACPMAKQYLHCPREPSPVHRAGYNLSHGCCRTQWTPCGVAFHLFLSGADVAEIAPVVGESASSPSLPRQMSRSAMRA